MELTVEENKFKADDLSKFIKLSAIPLIISAEVKGYEYKKVVGVEYTFVRGFLTVENKGTAKEVFELDKLCLSLGSIVSKGANIDSIAYFIPKIDIQPSQVVSKKVYWVLGGQLPTEQLKRAELLYKQNGINEVSCPHRP
jgi:hypothetical protein